MPQVYFTADFAGVREDGSEAIFRAGASLCVDSGVEAAAAAAGVLGQPPAPPVEASAKPAKAPRPAPAAEA